MRLANRHRDSEDPVTRVDRAADVGIEAVESVLRADGLEPERILIVARVREAPAGERAATAAFSLFDHPANNDDVAHLKEMLDTLLRAASAAAEALEALGVDVEGFVRDA